MRAHSTENNQKKQANSCAPSFPSITQKILGEESVNWKEICFLKDNTVSWQKHLIHTYSSNPACILDHTSKFPKELQAELNSIIPLFELMLFPVKENAITLTLITQLLYAATEAYRTCCHHPLNTKSQPFIGELMKFSSKLTDDQLNPQQILCLKLIIKDRQKYHLKEQNNILTNLVTNKLLTALPKHDLDNIKTQDTPFSDLINHYIYDEYLPYSQIMQGITDLDLINYEPILEFIVIRHENEKCAQDKNYYFPTITRRGIETRLTTLRFEAQQQKNKDYLTTNQKYKDFLSSHATESVADWEVLVECLIKRAFVDPEFILFCLNGRESIQIPPIPDIQELSRILEHIDRSSYYPFQNRVEQKLKTMQIDPHQLAASYGLIMEAIECIAVAYILDITFPPKKAFIEKKYPSDLDLDVIIVQEQIKCRNAIEKICCKKMGECIRKTPYYQHTYINYQRYSPETVVKMNREQLLHYLKSLSYQIQDASIRACYRAVFKQIDYEINHVWSIDLTTGSFFDKFQNFLSTSPVVLRSYVEHALSSKDISMYVKKSFFQPSTLNCLRFSNLAFVKKDIHSIINQIDKWYAPDFDVERLSSFIFDTCLAIENLSDRSGKFMLKQFCHLLDEKTSCPENLRAILLLPFRIWLDDNQILHPYYLDITHPTGQREIQRLGQG